MDVILCIGCHVTADIDLNRIFGCSGCAVRHLDHSIVSGCDVIFAFGYLFICSDICEIAVCFEFNIFSCEDDSHSGAAFNLVQSNASVFSFGIQPHSSVFDILAHPVICEIYIKYPVAIFIHADASGTVSASVRVCNIHYHSRFIVPLLEIYSTAVGLDILRCIEIDVSTKYVLIIGVCAQKASILNRDADISSLRADVLSSEIGCFRDRNSDITVIVNVCNTCSFADFDIEALWFFIGVSGFSFLRHFCFVDGYLFDRFKLFF